MKRLQLILSDDAWTAVEKIYTEATKDFKTGSINYSDVICEMLLNSKVDIKDLRAKHIDIRKSLLSLAKNKDLDVDAAIKALSEIKSKASRKSKPTASLNEVTE